MSLTIDEYSCMLINNFLFAHSPHEVHTFIYSTIKELKQHKVQPYIIKRFLDTTATHLQQYRPGDYDSKQWSNIKSGIIFLIEFKSSIAQII
jgi:hypothetical protein